MKKIIMLFVASIVFTSCGGEKVAVSSNTGNKIPPLEVPCTCAGITKERILQSEFDLGKMLVSVVVQGENVLLAPPVDVDAESNVLDGVLVRSFDIKGENAIEFPTGSHFMITKTEYDNSGSPCPSSIIAQINAPSGTLVSLKFGLSQGGQYLPVLDVENGNYVQERGLFRATNHILNKKVWIRNHRFRLETLYLAQESSDDRKTEKTRGYDKPTAVPKKL